MTITGSGFTGVTGVTFGGTAAAGFTAGTDTQMTAVSPLHVGGTVDVQVTTPGGTSAANPSDTFTFTNWTNLTPASPAPDPGSRDRSGMAIDSTNDYTLLFGGENGGGCLFTGQCLNDTWAWNGSSWTQLLADNPGGGPSQPQERVGSAMAFDPVTKKVVLFGGDTCADGCDTNDVWAWNGKSWTNVLADCSTGCGPNQPSQRHDALMASTGSALVLFGGGPGNPITPSNETWTSTDGGATWTRDQNNNARCILASPCASQPFVDSPSTSIASGPGGTVVLVQWSGFGSPEATWVFNPAGKNWTRKAVAAPISRDGAGLAYDSKRGVTVLFAGDTCGDGCTVNDTWLWNGASWTQDLLPPPNASPPARGGPMLAGDPSGGVLLFDGGPDDTWVYV